MITISLCMIVKNEEEVLARCLASVADITDEIIVVDTGSTDHTKAIARSLGAKVYDFAWVDDFAAARNASFGYATMDYIMWLDADDVILPADRELLLTCKQAADGTADTIMMPYHTAFDKAGRPTFFYERERLLRRAAQPQWQEPVHEVITPFGKIEHCPAAITHRKEKPATPGRNLAIYEKRRATGQPFSPRATYYFGRELFYAGRPAEAKEQLGLFLQQGGGWAPDCVEACILRGHCCRQPREQLTAFLEGLIYAVPTPRLCCSLGQWFLQERQLLPAVFWFEQATTVPPAEGFQSPDYRGYVPYLQLCVCYDHLADWEKARLYNEKAGAIKPQSEQVAHNRAYLAGRGYPSP